MSKLSIHSFIQVFINMFIYTYFYIHFNIKDFENNNCYIYCNIYCINNVKYYIFINHFASKSQRKNRNIQKNALSKIEKFLLWVGVYDVKQSTLLNFLQLCLILQKEIFSLYTAIKENAPEKMAAKMLTLPPTALNNKIWSNAINLSEYHQHRVSLAGKQALNNDPG